MPDTSLTQLSGMSYGFLCKFCAVFDCESFKGFLSLAQSMIEARKNVAAAATSLWREIRLLIYSEIFFVSFFFIFDFDFRIDVFVR